VTAEQLRDHERRENKQARRVLAREQAKQRHSTQIVLGDPSMVDPKATTRTEVPIDGNDSDSSGHDTDSSEGPHTPTPRDPPSEDELDYEDPADEVEQEVFQKEYRISVEEYTRLRKAYASMAVSTTSDSELAALKADIEKSKRVMKEFRAILQEHPATRKPSRRRDCKHETRRSDRGERRSWVLTSAVTLPSRSRCGMPTSWQRASIRERTHFV